MSKCILNMTGLRCRDFKTKDKLINPSFKISQEALKLWESYAYSEPTSAEESHALNGILTLVKESGVCYTKVLIPSLSNVKLAKVYQLIKEENVIQYIPC